MAGSVIQCHSLEDGYFQFGYTSIGMAASIGKGVRPQRRHLGDGGVLYAAAFLLKG